MYQLTPVKNQIIPAPVGYQPSEIENLYVGDYRNIIIILSDSFQYYIYHNKPNQQDKAILSEFNIVNYDKFLMIIRLMVNQLIVNLPPVILIQQELQQIRDIYEKIYYSMLQSVIISQHSLVQHILLITIENYIRVFLPIIQYETIYDLFNIFYENCLDIKVYNNPQLTMQIIQHLIRLYVGDNENNLEKFDDTYGNDSNVVNYCKQINIDYQFQEAFLQQKLRLVMPGILVFFTLFTSFDSNSKYENLFSQFFNKLHQISQQKELYQNQQVFNQCKFYKNGLIKLQMEVNYIKKRCDNTQLTEDFQQFVQFVYGGKDNINTRQPLNSKLQVQNTQIEYNFDTISQGIGCFCARFQQEYTNFILSIQKQQNYDIIFQIGIQKCDQNDIQNLHKKILLNKLSEISKNKPIKALTYFIQNSEEYTKQFQIEQVDISDNIKKLKQFQKDLSQEQSGKRVKRSFEQQMEYDMTLIANYYQSNKNEFEKIYQFVQFYLGLQKENKNDIGLTKETFGEIIGGNQIQSSVSLYLFNCIFWKKINTNKNTSYVTYIREYLSLFKLPGEGQIVDRILILITQKDQKTMHALAYAIIQLNTDLHNANVKNQMTIEQFVSNTKRIDYAQCLNDEMLRQIYQEIKEQPFTLSNIEQIKLKIQLQQKYFEDKNSPRSEKQQQPEQNDILYLPINVRQNLYQYELFQLTCHQIKQQQLIQKTLLSFDDQFLKFQLNSIEQNLMLTILYINLERKNFIICNGIKFGLLLCFNSVISTQQLSKQICDVLVSISGILQLSLLSFKSDDIQQPYMYEPKLSNKEYSIQNITATQLDLILNLIQVCYYFITTTQQNDCYLGQYQIGEAWHSIIPVCSRINYFYYLVEQKLHFSNRNQKQKTSFSDFKQLVYQSFLDQIQQAQYISIIQQFSFIYTYLYSANIIKYAEFILQNNQRYNIQEQHYICCSLAEQIQVESEIFITPSYHLCSADYLNLILTQLQQESCEQFQNTFKAVCSEYKYLFKHQSDTVSQNALDGIYQVVCAYIAAIKHNQNKQQQLLVGEIFLEPFGQYLDLSLETKQIWVITERLTSFMQYIQYKPIEGEQIKLEIVCPFSEQFLIKLNQLICSGINKVQILFMQKYTKDIALGQKQRQQFISQDIKQVLKLSEKYVQLMSKYNYQLLLSSENYEGYKQSLKSFSQIILNLLTQDLSDKTIDFIENILEEFIIQIINYMCKFDSINDNIKSLQEFIAQQICYVINNIIDNQEHYSIQQMNKLLQFSKQQLEQIYQQQDKDGQNKQKDILQQFIELLIIESINTYQNNQQDCECQKINDNFQFNCKQIHCQAEIYLSMNNLDSQRLKNILNILLQQKQLSTSIKLITIEVIQQLLHYDEIKYLIQFIPKWIADNTDTINLKYQIVLTILQYIIQQQSNIEDTFEFATLEYIKYEDKVNLDTMQMSNKLIINILQATTQLTEQQLLQQQIIQSLISISQTILTSKTQVEPKRVLLNVLLSLDKSYIKQYISNNIFKDVCSQICIESTSTILQLIQQFILTFYAPIQEQDENNNDLNQEIIKSQIVAQSKHIDEQEEPFDVSAFQ